MLHRFHALRRDEEGQSIVIACVALLILALGVMATLNLGRAIHQRVGLQQTADASAYSMAVLEARTFNFYSFTNRAQIAHYVSSMCVQSIISFCTFLLSMVAELIAFLKTLTGFCDNFANVCGDLVCAVLDVITAGAYADIAVVVNDLEELFDGLNQIFSQVDHLLALYINPLMQDLNKVLGGFNKLMKLAMEVDVSLGYPEVIKRRDDQLGAATVGKAAAGALSIALFRKAHMSESEDLDNSQYAGVYVQGDGKVAQAKRAMTEVANASRKTDGMNFITAGRDIDSIPFPGMSFLSAIFDHFFFKTGQAKMTGFSYNQHPNGPANDVHSTGFDHGQASEGNGLQADDAFIFGLFEVPIIGKYLAWGEHGQAGTVDLSKSGQRDKYKHSNGYSGHGPGDDAKLFIVSVFADKDGGVHWRPDMNKPIDKKKYGASLFGVGCYVELYYVNYKGDREGYHKWEGVTEYENFDISGTMNGEGERIFYNQPSTWTWLEKSYEQSKRDSSSGANQLVGSEMKNLKIATVDGNATMKTQNEAKVLPPFTDGAYNAISRGMVYYHRSRNWEEFPNFFNPYWRAKLDPVYTGSNRGGLHQAEAALPGGNALTSVTNAIGSALPVQKVLVH